MLQLVETPSEFLAGTSVSRHNSGLAPMIFKLQRQDFQTTNYADNGGSIEVRIATTDTSLFSLNDQVYFKATDNATTVEGTASITSVTVTSYTVIVIDLPFVSMTPVSQFINLVEVYYNYEANIEYYSVRDDSKIAAESRSADSSGIIRFDASPFVRSLDLTEDFDFLTPANDLKIAVPFYFKAGETKLATTSTPSRIDANDYFSILAAVAPGRQFGSNLGAELAFPGSTTVEQGLFLTDFERPRKFEGWPFSLSFMYFPNGIVDNLFISADEYDNNGTQLNASTDAISVPDLTEPIKIPLLPGGLQSGSEYILVSIEGTATFSFLTIINPGTDGTFDPSISTSSGTANWLFQDLSSILGSNSISTSGNGLDGTSQSVEISNLDPSVITGIDFQNDKISGKFIALALVNCVSFQLQDNVITSFTAPATSAAVTLVNLSSNPGLAAVDISGLSNVSGTINLSDCALTSSGLVLPINCSNPISSFDLSGNSLSYTNFATAFPNLGNINSASINLADNGLSQTEVNAFIMDFDRIFTGSFTSRSIIIDGTNSAPNLSIPAVAAAVASLNSKNVTVFYTGFVP